MEKALKQINKSIFHYVNGVKVDGVHKNIFGGVDDITFYCDDTSGTQPWYDSGTTASYKNFVGVNNL